MRRLLRLVLLSALVLVGCGGDDGGGGGGGDGEGDGAAPGSGDCPSTPFEGEIRRAEDPVTAGHVPVQLSGDDIATGFAVDIGDQVTVYLATYDLDGSEAGGTLVAPEGETLATVTVPLAASTDPTQSFLIVDSGGGASSSGVVQQVEVEPLDTEGDDVCLAVRIVKDHEAVDGTLNVPLVGG